MAHVLGDMDFNWISVSDSVCSFVDQFNIPMILCTIGFCFVTITDLYFFIILDLVQQLRFNAVARGGAGRGPGPPPPIIMERWIEKLVIDEFPISMS